jgi:hypothetical protein
MSASGRFLLVSLCIVLSAAATVQAGFKGEIDAEGGYAANTGDSLDAFFGEQRHWDQSLMVRIMWSDTFASDWNVDTAYLADTRRGGGVDLLRRERLYDPLFPRDPDETSLWHLNHVLTDRGQTYTEHRLDRLAVGYSSTHLVLKAGRQALTWGSGLVFHPMDLFNPFPPNATYTTYKLGTDMLYGQWLFNSGADVQAVVVPRRDPETDSVIDDQSSAGIKWHGFLGKDQTIGVDILLARNYETDVLGLGASGPLGGASWNAEVVPARLKDGTFLTSFLTNGQYAWVWNEKNMNWYVEYFHNGFGVSGIGHTLSDLPVSLMDRLSRGELFTVSSNYIATGIDVQWTPLLDLKPAVIANLDDGSVLLICQAIYSLSQNTNVTVGFQWGLGSRGSEYGGLETAPASGIYATSADQGYARLTWFF